MKLHGNGALSLKKRRRLLCRRVVDEEWSLTEAAAAAEVSERTAWKCLRRFRDEGEAGLLPARRPRTVFKTGRPRRASRRSRRCAAAALHGRPDRRAAADAGDDGVGGSCAGSGSVAAVG